ncbi:MAG TPA: carbohydrate porin [Burkholderiales bacterium]|nr:carbohydrate porin [Burkholderiales bacterium]
MRRFVAGGAMLAWIGIAAAQVNQDLPEGLSHGPFELHGQATYVRQYKPAFPADYTGPKSLSPDKANSWSFTGTLFFGARLTDTLELYVNPEAAAGVPFSQLQGVAAFTNAEIARTSGPTLTPYFARAFVRKTWNLGGELQREPSAQNQLAMSYAAERIVLTAGLVSVLDIFSGVDYSRDPRTQFLNWSSTTYGAWDFPADARGYTWGAALEYVSPAFSGRAGWFAGPKESNGLSLDFSLGKFYGSVVELEVPTELGGRPGNVQLLAFRNRANMGSFNDAIALGRDTGSVPDLTLVRRPQTKWGFGVTVQQELAENLGGYVRAGWNDGRTETYMFTEIDRSIAAGVLASGQAWDRARDSAGVALYWNMLGGSHREYLALGGEGFFLGDGRLNYGPESTVEAFYSLNVISRLWVSADYQYQTNPGYNRDRGPVNYFGFRIHADF